MESATNGKEIMEGALEPQHQAWNMAFSGHLCSMTIRAACLLHIPDILASYGDGAYLSPSQIASHFSTNSPNLDYLLRLMRFLSFHGVFSAQASVDDMNGEPEWRFALTPISQWLSEKHKPLSMAPTLLLATHQFMQRPMEHLHECILEGGSAYERAFGMTPWDVYTQNSVFAELFNNSMATISVPCMEAFLKGYHSFDGIHTLVDVGGGLGHAISRIVQQNPSIKGINFDRPNVIPSAPTYPGVVHVSGDMFESVPKGDAIFLKWILHDWDDSACVQILKNCMKALPVNGKVIILEIVLRDMENYPTKEIALSLDLMMLTYGGRERTEGQWKALIKKAGFTTFNIINFSSIWSAIEAKPLHE